LSAQAREGGRVKTALVLALALALSGCGFAERHPTRARVLGIIVGAGVGASIAYAVRPGHCPSIYDGRPYSGTPPCPR
jgi:hypothetical protein